MWINYWNKFGKYFNSRYPVVNDNEGLPTLMKENDERKLTLTLSQTRFILQKSISRDLQEIMYFKEDEAEQLSQYYLRVKYKEYCDYIMNL